MYVRITDANGDQLYVQGSDLDIWYGQYGGCSPYAAVWTGPCAYRGRTGEDIPEGARLNYLDTPLQVETIE